MAAQATAPAESFSATDAVREAAPDVGRRAAPRPGERVGGASTISAGRVARTGFGLTLFSLATRCLAIVTTMLTAALFGTNGAYESFIIAGSVPLLFSNVLLLTALPRVFVPLFTDYAAASGEREAWRFASTIATILMLAAVVAMGIGVVAAPFIVDVSAPGLAPSSRLLAIQLARGLFVTVGLSAISTLITGVLNAYRIFLAPAIWNLAACIICLALLALVRGRVSVWILVINNVLLLAIPIAGLLISQRRLLLRYFRPSLNVRQHGLGKLAGLTLGLLVISLTNHVNVVSDRYFASLLGTGAIAVMEYASRQVPIIIAMFVSTIVGPLLVDVSVGASTEGATAVARGLDVGMRLTALVLLPVIAFHELLRVPIFTFLLEGGAFAHASTPAVGSVFLALTPALVFWGLGQVLNTAFFAMRQIKLPVIVTTSMVAVNILFDLAFVRPFGLQGLAVASGIGAGGGFFILLYGLRRQCPSWHLGPLFATLGRIALAAAAAALLALPAAALPPALQPPRLDGAMRVACGGLVMLPAYALFLHMLGVEEVVTLRRGVGRRLAKRRDRS